jgi:hypothetical protein
MKMFNRIAIAAAVVGPMAFAAPASAQSWKWDIGAQAGYARFTKSVTADSLGLASSADNDPYLRFENKVRFGGTLGYWFTKSVGLRADYKYSDNSLMEGQSETKIIEPVNLHSGSLDLLFRLGQPNETWSGFEFLPYLALGAGAKWANPTQDVDTCVESDGKGQECSAAVLPQGGRPFALAEDKTIMGLVGLGTDLRFSPHVALSLEASDRIFRPQIAAATLQAGSTTIFEPNNDHRISKWTHELGVDVGLKFLFGLASPPVVAVAPAPAPPPPPPPPPAPLPPPPAPREDAIQVCVVDLTQANGLRMQNAIYLPASGDTMVVMNGSRVRLAQSVGNVMTVRNADWYVAGRPLEITINKDKMSYGTEGGAVMIESGKLAYLGTVNGYPVYANRDVVADVASKVAAARAADASRDLGAIIAADKALRGEMEDVKYLYVPLQPTGCVFQAFHYMEPVKKGK